MPVLEIPRETEIAKWLAAHAQGAARLARCVSLAASVEPELLRAARLRFCADLGVEAESEVWFSPLVESRSLTGLIFSSKALDAMWRDFPQLLILTEIRDLTRQYRAGVPLAIELEEEIAYWSLSQDPSASSRTDAALARILATLLRPERQHLAMWAQRALPRLQHLIADNQRFALLQQAAHERGAALLETSDVVPEWIRPTSSMRIIGAALFKGGILFRDPPATGELSIEVPAGQPVRLAVSNDAAFSDSQRLTLRSQQTVWHTPWRPPFYIRIAGGDTWKLDRLDPDKQRIRILVYGPTAPTQLLWDIKDALDADELETDRSPPHVGDPPMDDSLIPVLVCVGPFRFDNGLEKDPLFRRFRDSGRHVVLVVEATTVVVPELPHFGYIPTESPDLSLPASQRWGLQLDELIAAIRSSSDLPANIDSVPPLPEGLVGIRDRLQELSAVFHGSTLPGPKITALTGEEGIGRRTLAIAAARDPFWRRRYSGGIHWLSSPPDSVSAGSKRLFICDYSDEAFEWLPSEEQDAVIILTREWSETFSPTNTFTVRPLTAQETATLWARYPDATPVAEQIPTTNPLAIRTLGHMSRRFEGATFRIDGNYTEIAEAVFQRVLELEVGLMKSGGHQALAFRANTPVPEWLFQELVGTDKTLSAELSALNILKSSSDTSTLVRGISARLGTLMHCHVRIVEAYEKLCWADWTQCLRQHDDGYFRTALLHHLRSCGRNDEADDIGWDYDWILTTTLRRPPHQLRYLAFQSADRNAQSLWSHIANELRQGNDIEQILLGEMPGGDRLRVSRLRRRATSRILLLHREPRPAVLVVGSGGPQIELSEVYPSEALGRELARAGFALLSGGWPGVDHMVCREYVRELRTLEVPPNFMLTHVIPANSYPDLWTMKEYQNAGQRDALGAPHESIHRSVAQSQAVIVVGGMGGTNQIVQIARSLHVKVFPVPGSGGVADRLAAEQNMELRRIENYVEAWKVIRATVAAVAEHLQPQSG